jgi:hypothetical protein
MVGISLLLDHTSIRKMMLFGQGKIYMRRALYPLQDAQRVTNQPMAYDSSLTPFKINGKKDQKMRSC